MQREELNYCHDRIRVHFPEDFIGGEEKLEESIDTLFFCHKELQRRQISYKAKYANIRNRLRGYLPVYQAALFHLVRMIFKDSNVTWPEWTYDGLTVCITPFILLLQIGPVRLAEGLDAGIALDEIFRTAQSAWLDCRLEAGAGDMTRQEMEYLQCFSDEWVAREQARDDDEQVQMALARRDDEDVTF